MDKRNRLIAIAKRFGYEEREVTFTHDARIRKTIQAVLDCEGVEIGRKDPIAWAGHDVFVFGSATTVHRLDMTTEDFAETYERVNARRYK